MIMWQVCFTAWWLGMLSLAFTLPARGQDGQIGHGHESWHQGFYQTLMRPDGKGWCCNLTDCRPTSGRAVGDHYEVRVNGAWVSVPTDKIIRRTAPDGGFHVCAPHTFAGNGEQLYCVIVAPEG